MPIIFSNVKNGLNTKASQPNTLLILGMALIVFALVVMAKPEILAYLVAYGCLLSGVSIIWIWLKMRK